ncbi:MAG: hypothetical protein OEY64_11520 [Nitrospinota bacterium]|nr:hypothetical protein [Nitrospinota bacterium]
MTEKPVYNDSMKERNGDSSVSASSIAKDRTIRVKSFDDIKRLIESTAKPDVVPHKAIELGGCGFGMPVIRSFWALDEMKSGEILKMDSSHLCSYPDIHAFVRNNKNVELVGETVEGGTISYYLKKL